MYKSLKLLRYEYIVISNLFLVKLEKHSPTRDIIFHFSSHKKHIYELTFVHFGFYT